ncbi:MAG: hypothetical protein DBX59_07430 [Bacillota bacterium]|nr:MAG: hypothetical protein DBX59_07430 [Bacillota bacterium]
MKKILIFALCLALLFPLAGCKKEDDGKDVNNNLLLCDFESQSELGLVSGGNYFGKYVLNDNADYVKHGAKSLALTPTGYGLATSPDPYLIVQPWKLGEEYEDFSSVKKVQFDIFNANAEDKEIEVCFLYGTATSTLQTPKLRYTLAANKWTKVIYKNDTENFDLIYDLKDLREIQIYFENVAVLEEEKKNYYIDNFVLGYAESALPTANIVLSDNEFCNFEKDYQEFITYTSGYGAYDAFAPVLSVNKDALYVKEGARSLKVNCPHGAKQDSSWIMFRFSDKLVKAADFAKYQDDCDFVFDVYNDSPVSMRIELDLFAGDRGTYAVNFYAEPSKWTEVRVSLADVNELLAPPKKEGETDEDVANKPTGCELIEGIACIWGEFPGSSAADDRVYYYDNFRFEKNA